jgi:hypothetical protein
MGNYLDIAISIGDIRPLLELCLATSGEPSVTRPNGQRGGKVLVARNPETSRESKKALRAFPSISDNFR